MFNRRLAIASFLVTLVFHLPHALAASWPVKESSCQRKLAVTRVYQINVQPGKPCVAAIPGLMSFWGQTNWQIVTSSSFEYSENPDSIRITSDNLGMPRRNYELTWNAPKSLKITVKQTLLVELSCFGTLYTAAQLPYPEEVRKRFADSLGADKSEGINPDNPALIPVCDQIAQKSHGAEETVEAVCDWVDENIKFKMGTGNRTSDEALTLKEGSCTPMSRIACSMLRRIGIPAETVPAKFIGGDGGHTFMEVYFPDAGWVFYDLSNANRGFKSLDCLMTVGWAYRSGTPQKQSWTDGHFCTEKDSTRFKDVTADYRAPIRMSPKGMKVLCASVVTEKPPDTVKSRQRPIKELIMDLAVPPGPRDYTDSVIAQASSAGK